MGFPTADLAEDTFYAAFSRGDHHRLMSVWANSTDIVCIHPFGPRHVGFESVSASWAQILSTDEPREFKHRKVSCWADDNIAVHVVDEIISIPNSDSRFAPVLATNVYRRIADQWYLVTHHASIDARQNIPDSSTQQTRH